MLTEQQIARKQQFEKYYEVQSNKRDQLKNERQQWKALTKDPRELQLHVQKEFRQQYESILKPINDKEVKQPEQINSLIDDFKNLFAYYVDISYALIAYDKQQYKEQLEQLECTLYSLRSSIIPRQKFAFSKPFPKPQQILAEKEQVVQQNHDDSIVINEDNFQDNVNMTSGSVVLQNLNNRTFTVNGTLDTLYLHSLTNSTINVGKINGSVWVNKCINCNVKGSMHQLRIHDSEQTTFIINVSSNPIIERSTGLKFGAIDLVNNQWNQVQDFNWLKQEQSPNFTLI